jgi:hypothetical protein
MPDSVVTAPVNIASSYRSPILVTPLGDGYVIRTAKSLIRLDADEADNLIDVLIGGPPRARLLRYPVTAE